MSKKQGKNFGKRLTVQDSETGVQANQWQATQQQQNWLIYYMDPKHKDTYGNSYQAAIKAGYSEAYASRIMSDSMAVQWVRQARNIMRLNPEHLKSVLQEIINNKYEKTADRLAAIKLLGGEQGMFIQKTAVGVFNIEDALNELK